MKPTTKIATVDENHGYTKW